MLQHREANNKYLGVFCWLVSVMQTLLHLLMQLEKAALVQLLELLNHFFLHIKMIFYLLFTISQSTREKKITSSVVSLLLWATSPSGSCRLLTALWKASSYAPPMSWDLRNSPEEGPEHFIKWDDTHLVLRTMPGIQSTSSASRNTSPPSQGQLRGHAVWVVPQCLACRQALCLVLNVLLSSS